MMMRTWLASLALLVVTGATAPAIQFRTADAYVLQSDQTVTEELWLVTGTADIRGTAEDDVFAVGNAFDAASSTTLSGAFGNDVWAVANTVTVTGRVKEHGRLLANTVELGGRIGASLAAAGSSIRLAKASEVAGDAILFCENALLEGEVGGNLRLFAYSVTLSGKFAGNVRVVAEDIVVMPGTEIKGNLTYTSSKELFLDQNVALGGQLVRKEVTKPAEAPSYGPRLNEVVVTQAFLYLCALVVALPFVAIFAPFAGRAVRLIRQSSWKCALVGLAAFCLMPMLGVFALFTIIGIPLSVILLATYGLMIYLSKIVVALVVGGVLLRRRGPQPFSRVFTALSLGLILLYALAALPTVGLIVWFLTVLLGFGGMVLAVFAPLAPAAAEPPPLAPSGPPPVGQEPPTFGPGSNPTQRNP